jgi:small ligand-binding sensory domain FIST
MIFKAALSTEGSTHAAIREVAGPVSAIAPDLVLVFSSMHHGPDFDNALAELRDAIPCRNLIGCTGDGIIGPDREVEQGPALAAWGAKMPGVRALPFFIDQNDVMNFEEHTAWYDRLGVTPDDKPSFVVLPDPFSIHMERCLSQMDEAFVGSTIVGGMASGARAQGENRLFINDQVLRQGMVGVSLTGAIRIHSVVSQGCRPVGEPFVITKADENVIFELRGKPALEVLRGVFNEANSADQALMQQGVHVGRVVDERVEKFGSGNFLIRNVAGVVQDDALAVTALVRAGQTIQFHVRDGASADEDMRSLLAGKVANLGQPAHGGLLFTCNGRGRRLFGAPNHDIGVVNAIAKDCQTAGFFAAGEIGPIGNKTFLHGFTSSLILFNEA